jgi:hypothetical protein
VVLVDEDPSRYGQWGGGGRHATTAVGVGRRTTVTPGVKVMMDASCCRSCGPRRRTC